MSNDYYADAAPAPAAAPAEDTEAPDAAPEGDQEEAGDSQTAEIPKGVLGGKEFKPGEEVVLEVVQVNEDSVLVRYASEKGGEEEEAPEPAEGQMTSLMQ